VAAASRPRLSYRFAPTRRSLAVGLALAALAALAYVLARETSAFAIRRIEVRGATPAVAAQVRRALAPFVGRSLVGLDGAALERRVEALPSVVSVDYDRAFPHTLRLDVVPERPVAVLRRGREAWLLSARARLIARLPRGAEPSLPRIWSGGPERLEAGGFLARGPDAVAARALAFAARFPARIAAAAFADGSLVFRLRSGVELRLGDPGDIRLKLAVARRALPDLPRGSTYLDVSLPSRPVAGSTPEGATNPQVSRGG